MADAPARAGAESAAPADARAARAGGVGAARRGGPGHPARGQRRPGSTVEPARRRATEPALRASVRRQPPSGARPIVPRGVRPRPRRAAVSAAPARGSPAARRSPRAGRCRPRSAGDARRPRAPAAATGRRRGDGAALHLVSQPRAGRVAAARPVLLRARRRPRCHGHVARARHAGPQGRGGLGRATRVARAAGPNRGLRRSRARPLGACTALQGKGWRGDRARALPAEVERALEAGSDRAVEPLDEAVVAGRRGDAHDRRHQAAARTASPDGTAVLAVCAAALRRLSVSVPAVGDLSPRAGGGARAAPAHGSADTRPSVPLHSDGVLPDARARRPASDPVGGVGQRDVVVDGTRRGRRVPRRTGASRRARVGRRGARARDETCCGGSITSARIPTAGSRGGSSSPSAFRTTPIATRGV